MTDVLDDEAVDFRWVCAALNASPSTVERRIRDDPNFPKFVLDGGKRKTLRSLVAAYKSHLYSGCVSPDPEEAAA